jgi:hypothetical protein
MKGNKDTTITTPATKYLKRTTTPSHSITGSKRSGFETVNNVVTLKSIRRKSQATRQFGISY